MSIKHKNNKPKQAQPVLQKIAVSTPGQAMKLFQEFRANSGEYITIKGSRAKWYTAQQMVDWFKAQGKSINLGWLARALHCAAQSGMKISTGQTELNDRTVTIYKAS